MAYMSITALNLTLILTLALLTLTLTLTPPLHKSAECTMLLFLNLSGVYSVSPIYWLFVT